MMRTKRFLKQSLFVVMILLLIGVSPAFSQDEDPRNPIYICLTDEENPELIEIRATEPIVLIFERNVNVVVYSSPNVPMIADVITIEPDTATGTYRKVRDVVRGAHTSPNILAQGNCERPEETENLNVGLSELEHTILLPLTSDQALVIHTENQSIPYDNAEASLFGGAIGVLFRDGNASFPHFQILRVTSDSNDTISLRFPYFTEEEVRLYVVSKQPIEYTFTNDNAESQPKPMENREFFLGILEGNGDDLIDDILTPGDFRFYVEFGEEITYRRGTLQNFSRLSSFVPRQISESTIVDPIYCNPTPYFRMTDYNQHIYFGNSPDTVGTIRCGERTAVEEVLDNGILVVEGGFYIASWLVDIVP